VKSAACCVRLGDPAAMPPACGRLLNGSLTVACRTADKMQLNKGAARAAAGGGGKPKKRGKSSGGEAPAKNSCSTGLQLAHGRQQGAAPAPLSSSFGMISNKFLIEKGCSVSAGAPGAGGSGAVPGGNGAAAAAAAAAPTAAAPEPLHDTYAEHFDRCRLRRPRMHRGRNVEVFRRKPDTTSLPAFSRKADPAAAPLHAPIVALPPDLEHRSFGSGCNVVFFQF